MSALIECAQCAGIIHITERHCPGCGADQLIFSREVLPLENLDEEEEQPCSLD